MEILHSLSISNGTICWHNVNIHVKSELCIVRQSHKKWLGKRYTKQHSKSGPLVWDIHFNVQLWTISIIDLQLHPKPYHTIAKQTSWAFSRALIPVSIYLWVIINQEQQTIASTITIQVGVFTECFSQAEGVSRREEKKSIF